MRAGEWQATQARGQLAAGVMMIAGLLADVTRRAIERWFASIVLPGLLFAVALACARDLSWAHMADLSRLRTDATGWLTTGHGWPAGDAVLIIGVICAGIVAGLMAIGLSHATSKFWLKQTRVGRRMHAIDADVSANYGVSLARAWPRLWLLSSDNARREVQAAWDNYAFASLLAAWGVIYSALGLYWPPSIVIGLVLLAMSHWSAYRCARAFAELAMALVDITMNQLAAVLGVDIPHGRVTPEIGREINEILHVSEPAALGKDLPRLSRSAFREADRPKQ
jgi:hypothetical protein